ncbi:SDR family NAD(P)-dependent oxidoreductase [Microlunatus sp. GCM10028923]|uniref:SDR family NAD(P)-dependent oxidoreductase n=1 Tax=Microlunatus sp. GCM10028923 TaxID=3273400 RepID=UPI00361298A6
MDRERTVLITGGTGGLGAETARALLAGPDLRVIITGRSPAGVGETATRLGDRADGRVLDLGSLADVRSFVADLPPLDAIIANAGLVGFTGLRLTEDGFEETFGVNHLGHFLLIREALPRMPAGSRVVFVTSATHDPAQRTGFPPPAYDTAERLAHPDSEQDPDPLRAGRRRYTTSKLCNLLACYEFARRTRAAAVTFNAFDPGQMPGTGLARDFRGIRAFVWHRVMPALTLIPGINRNTPRRSAAALARLITDPGLAAVTGRYFTGRRETTSSADSYDEAKAADLWQTSVALTAGH